LGRREGAGGVSGGVRANTEKELPGGFWGLWEIFWLIGAKLCWGWQIYGLAVALKLEEPDRIESGMVEESKEMGGSSGAWRGRSRV